VVSEPIQVRPAVAADEFVFFWIPPVSEVAESELPSAIAGVVVVSAAVVVVVVVESVAVLPAVEFVSEPGLQLVAFLAVGAVLAEVVAEVEPELVEAVAQSPSPSDDSDVSPHELVHKQDNEHPYIDDNDSRHNAS